MKNIEHDLQKMKELLKNDNSTAEIVEQWIKIDTYNELPLSKNQLLLQFFKVLSSANSLFENDKSQAVAWMKTPVKGLEGKRPIEMTSTLSDIKITLNIIGRTEHGVFS